MKSREVLKILKITRPTLTKYVKNGVLKVKVMPNGQYDYDEDSVLSLGNVSKQRECVIYARVSTQKQKKDLENQVDTLVKFANSNGYKVNNVYSDIASGLNYDRKTFKDLLNEVLQFKIKTIIIENKDRFTRISFDLWRNLFKQFCCDIIVMNEDTTNENEEKEIFSDIISLLHCFAMKMYSQRRKRKIKLIAEDMENEIGV